jgi:hypothetical protein
MIAILTKFLKSFKGRMLLGFLSLSVILLVWASLFIFFSRKQNGLLLLTYHLEQLQNTYSESNRHLHDFVLSGYREDSFYLTRHQKDIDAYLNEQKNIEAGLQNIEKECGKFGIDIQIDINALAELHHRLLDSVQLMKQIYYEKGFYDFGNEGTLRHYAHLLENNPAFNKVDMLTLRRREKDYLLREDPKYIIEFSTYIDSILPHYASSPIVYTDLLKYRASFDSLVNNTRKLDILQNHGLYYQIKHLIQQLDSWYVRTNRIVIEETKTIDNEIKYALIGFTALVFGLTILLSGIYSKNLTKDIVKLNEMVSKYINSMFNDHELPDDAIVSNILEVQHLNKNFSLLKLSLKLVLSDLEEKINAEKNATSKLAANVVKLYQQMDEIEQQKHQIEQSEAKLNVFFNSSSSCHIMVGRDLDIIDFNMVAANFFSNLFETELIKGENILNFIKGTYQDYFICGFRDALDGKFSQEECLFLYPGKAVGIWWNISFSTATDKDGNIFGVSFSGTNINENKLHLNKINSQNDALSKIAHVQSHEIRGPLASILGLIYIIKEEGNFNQEYLDMLEEAVNAFDTKIRNVVDYTRQSN